MAAGHVGLCRLPYHLECEDWVVARTAMQDLVYTPSQVNGNFRGKVVLAEWHVKTRVERDRRDSVGVPRQELIEPDVLPTKDWGSVGSSRTLELEPPAIAAREKRHCAPPLAGNALPIKDILQYWTDRLAAQGRRGNMEDGCSA